jgi:hypothetical protein
MPSDDAPFGSRLRYYRERARTMREAAETVQDPINKESLVHLARAYEEMVARLERDEDQSTTDDTPGSNSR